jgi:hypothetical protein
MSFRVQEKSLLETQLDQHERAWKIYKQMKMFAYMDGYIDHYIERKIDSLKGLKERLVSDVHQAVLRGDPDIHSLSERAVVLYNKINKKVDKLKKGLGYKYDDTDTSNLPPHDDAYHTLWLDAYRPQQQLLPYNTQLSPMQSAQWHFHHNLL